MTALYHLLSLVVPIGEKASLPVVQCGPEGYRSTLKRMDKLDERPL